MRITITISIALVITAAFPSAAEGKRELVKLPIELPLYMLKGTPAELKPPNPDPQPPKKRKPFFAPKGTEVISRGKPVTASDPYPFVGELEFLTDGDKEGAEGSVAEFDRGLQWVQIDLEDTHEIYAVLVWHYHSQARYYFDIIAKTATDPDFIEDVHILFSNDHDNSARQGIGKEYEYLESREGKLIDAKGVRARYLRLYSNGSTASEFNHYIEVEVWGRPMPKPGE